ncbi:MAG: DNA polymerase III subunit beta [Acidobacteria bacterium]|nr:DNA polymerase III subunit beta [Acidobacteriota bacterium]
MEFTVKKDALEKNLQLMQGVVETKITMPILANVWMKAEEGLLHLKATDLEIGLENCLECDVRSAGTTTLNVKKLYEFVKLLPDGDIRFQKSDDTGVLLTSGKIRREIPELPPVEFPRLPDFPVENRVTLDVKQFCDLLVRIMFNISTEEQQQHRGCLFVMTPEALMMVATDGHRLTYVKKADKFGLPHRVQEYRFLLSRKTIHTILRIQTGEKLEMVLGENHVFFGIGSNIISSRLPEMKFPNYERVIPKDHDKVMTVSTAEFLQALRFASQVSTDKARPTTLRFSKNALELSASGPGDGKFEEPIAAEYASESMEIQFNAQYLMDFLQVVGTEQVRVDLKDPGKAAILRPAGEVPYDYFYVLMPMRV